MAIVDGFVGEIETYGNIGAGYSTTASLPSDATKVIGNFVYGAPGNYGKTAVIDTIRAERMVSGFNASIARSLTEWVADMPNLKSCVGPGFSSCFYSLPILSTFIGDLSSLEHGDIMFYGCNALTTFIGDLSSLESGVQMFGSGTDSTSSSKLNS
jgi:hypothetical protein